VSEWQRRHDESIAQQAAAADTAVAQTSPVNRAVVASFASLAMLVRLVLIPVYVVVGTRVFLDGTMPSALVGVGLFMLFAISLFRTSELVKRRRQVHHHWLTGLPTRTEVARP
jgi:ABC-type multidrug transport system fused ATPase/permease subunit